MGLHDALALIQANAKPFFLRRLERMKQRAQDGWLDAGTIIGYRNDRHSVPVGRSDVDVTVCSARLLGIEQYVEQDLLDLVTLYSHDGKAFISSPDRDTQPAIERFEGFRKETTKIHFLPVILFRRERGSGTLREFRDERHHFFNRSPYGSQRRLLKCRIVPEVS